MFHSTNRQTAVGICSVAGGRTAQTAAGRLRAGRWRTQGCALVVLVSLVFGQQLRGAETLTLQGTRPRVIFDDNAGDLQLWSLIGDSTGFDVVDDTAGFQVPFHIAPGTPQDALYLRPDTGGRANVGIGGVPTDGIELHLRSNSVQNIRMTSTGSPDYNWDIIATELAWYVEDTTSAIPFLIEADAPHSSIRIKANGSIGMGTTFPDANTLLDIRSKLLNGLLMKRATPDPHYLRVENSGGVFRAGVQGSGDAQFGALTSGKGLNLLAGGTGKVAINALGQISFGNPPPAITTHALVHTSGARLTNVGVWANASSRDFKQDIEPITSEQARDTVRALQPMTYRYKVQPEEPYAGFIAEDVPELVATSDRKSLAPMDFVAVLTKVVQDQDLQLVGERQRNDQQQKLIEQQQEALKLLSRQVAELKQMIGDRRDQAK